MTYQEERLASLKRQRTKLAIDLAMQGRWREAIAANRAILEDFPSDVDAWNRLGRAHMELGEYQPSREAYRRTAELDPFNTIARKNLQRLTYLGEAKVTAESTARKVEPHWFIEDIGKAGVVNLYHLAPTQVRARLVAGDELFLKTNGTRLVVEDDLGQYAGHVDPKHGQRLVKLMAGGNKYSVAVVSSTEEAMTVIIREVYQDSSQIGKQSFPSKGVEEIKPHVDEKVFKMESEIEEILPEESGYTIIGGDEIEVLPEESTGISDESASEEE